MITNQKEYEQAKIRIAELGEQLKTNSLKENYLIEKNRPLAIEQLDLIDAMMDYEESNGIVYEEC